MAKFQVSIPQEYRTWFPTIGPGPDFASAINIEADSADQIPKILLAVLGVPTEISSRWSAGESPHGTAFSDIKKAEVQSRDRWLDALKKTFEQSDPRLLRQRSTGEAPVGLGEEIYGITRPDPDREDFRSWAEWLVDDVLMNTDPAIFFNDPNPDRAVLSAMITDVVGHDPVIFTEDDESVSFLTREHAEKVLNIRGVGQPPEDEMVEPVIEEEEGQYIPTESAVKTIPFSDEWAIENIGDVDAWIIGAGGALGDVQEEYRQSIGKLNIEAENDSTAEITRALTRDELTALHIDGKILSLADIDALWEASGFTKKTYSVLNDEGEIVGEELHPYYELLLDLMQKQRGAIANTQVEAIIQRAKLAEATIMADANEAIAIRQGRDQVAISRNRNSADERIAKLQRESEDNRLKWMQETETARITAEEKKNTELFNLKEQELAELTAIREQELDIAEIEAQASGPFGYLAQADTEIEGDRAQRVQDIRDILGAQYSPLAGASPYGALAATPFPEEFVPEDPNLRWQTIADIQQAQAATNPFGALQLGQGMGDISTILRGGLTPDQQLALARAPGNPFGFNPYQQISLQESLARGGLTPQQRLAEIQATSSPQQMANMLNFIGNPAAVGYATQTGMLQDIADSQPGFLPGSAIGLNMPQQQVVPTSSPVPVNPTIAHLADLSDTDRAFYYGNRAAMGATPSQVEQEAQSYTPKAIQPF